jgi:hippurate hydrolase
MGFTDLLLKGFVMNLLDPIVAWQDDITAIRRDLHAHPELAYEEHRTADTVAHWLTEWGIDIHRGLAGTGVVGIIKGNLGPGPSIGLRADMDALPVLEQNDFAHASRHDGKMHACGHDGHTAMLLSAARYLASHREFTGTVYVIFQPAEEGFAGARKMIEEGLFTRFPMDAVFGMHNWPGLPAGEFAVHPGAVMASSNSFSIQIDGKGAHGGMPHLGVDPITAAAQLVMSLQTIVSRVIDPLDPAVLSVTQIHAGSADNVIPTSAILRGTVRTLSNEALDTIETRMREIIEQSCAAMGCQSTFEFDRRYPPTINHAKESAISADVIRKMAGDNALHQDLPPSMGAEDFAFMLQERPGSYIWIGNGQGDHRISGHGLGPCMLHNDSYDFNDEILSAGASYWVRLAEHYLKP